MTSQKTLLTGTAALAIIGATLLATASPSEAQRAPRGDRAMTAPRADVGPGGFFGPFGSYNYGYATPYWAARPGECFTDEGYGRFLPCDFSGGN